MLTRLAVLLQALFLSSAAIAAQVPIHSTARLELPPQWQALKPVAPRAFTAERLSPNRALQASMVVHTEDRRSHAEALQRLADIEAEYPGKGTFVLIGGWPGFERKVSAMFPRAGEEPPRKKGVETSLRSTTAVAAGNLLIRVETLLQPDAPPAVADEALAVARKLALPAGSPKAKESLQKLKGGTLRPQKRRPVEHAPESGPQGRKRERGRPGVLAGGAAQSVGGSSEIEAAVSGNGQALMTNAGCGLSFSTDSGKTYGNSNVNFGSFTLRDGDCTITWAPSSSGTFYLGWLGGLVGGSTGPFTIAVLKSTDSGKNFNLVKVAVNNPPSSGPRVDQPHLVADRFNSAPGGKDRLYLTWQQGNSLNSFISCSKDSGVTWSAPQSANGGSASLPRVHVGKDGLVYVISRSGGSAVIDKFSSCDSGFNLLANFPQSISINDVPCPVAGLDRCNSGNTLSSPTIAVDDTNPNNVFVGWADSNGSGEDILVALSKDGGQTFGAAVAVSSAKKARRYMPWLAVWNGTVHAGWYDKRDATKAKPDLTRYFRGSAKIVAGKLKPNAEQDLSGGVDDAECAGGFGSVRAANDCSICNISNAACNVVPSGGGPKYGDYNGIAAGNGRVLHVWASQVTPGGATVVGTGGGVRAWANVTQLCGQDQQQCCPAAPACDAQTICGPGSTCKKCGDSGQPCCQSGATCNANLVCDASKTCTCGGKGQPCCGGSNCGPYLTCASSGSTNTCQCGGLSQACCGGSTCNSALLACSPNSVCLSSCGHQGQQCCHSAPSDQPPTHSGSAPGWCYGGDTCAGDSCACGGQGQPCCQLGAQCGAGLSCLDLLCLKPKSNGPSCAQCTANLNNCLKGCATDPAHAAQCKCLCQNTGCDCQQNAGCTLHCQFQSCTGP